MSVCVCVCVRVWKEREILTLGQQLHCEGPACSDQTSREEGQHHIRSTPYKVNTI